MIVCLCANVSEREVIAAIGAGAKTLKDIGSRCGAGAGCGSCRATLREYLASFRAVSVLDGAAQRKGVADGDLAPP